VQTSTKEISNMTVAKRGIDLLHDPQLNKSTAFTAAVRTFVESQLYKPEYASPG
jgi:hypothetical protein